jgi:hypothetical protein
MGFYSDYISKNGSTNLERAVNVEWVLKKLDEIGNTLFIPAYNAFPSWEILNVGDRGNLSQGNGIYPNVFTWTSDTNGKYEIVSLFSATSSLYIYLAKSVY